MTTRILIGDCRDVLRSLPSESVHCAVTSPPYFGLRNYGVDGQIGLEATPQEYVATMVGVFREVRRVLRADGTLWLNLGSSYISDYIESHEYVIRSDITKQERTQALQAIAAAITEAVSQVREADASAEYGVSGLSSEREGKTGELSSADVPEVRKAFHCPQSSCESRPSEVLQSILCEVWQPHAQEGKANCRMPDVREAVRQAQIGNEEDEGNEAFLLPGMLVQPQREGQSLSLDGGAARSDESGRVKVAQGGDDAGQMALPDMSRQQEVGGAPYSSVWNSPAPALGDQQRPNVVPQLPRGVSSPRIRTRRDPVFHSVGAGDGLKKISLPKAAIPIEVLHLFQPRHIAKPKDDAMIPEQIALALRDDGWIMRQTICWSKPNPMPESVTDRCTKAHEYLFLLSKSARYFYDAEAIKEEGSGRTPGNRTYKYDGLIGHETKHGILKQSDIPQLDRNKRSVWEIATAPFAEAHFATFPPALVEPCIKAGTSEKGCCAECGAPWVRETIKSSAIPGDYERGKFAATSPQAAGRRMTANVRARRMAGGAHNNPFSANETLGWSPSCKCDGAVVPCTVLDCFGGAGTTGLVADRLQRDAILIELNESYAAMAKRRIAGDSPLFSQVAAE
jgi:DNA modification methylase